MVEVPGDVAGFGGHGQKYSDMAIPWEGSGTREPYRVVGYGLLYGDLHDAYVSTYLSTHLLGGDVDLQVAASTCIHTARTVCPSDFRKGSAAAILTVLCPEMLVRVNKTILYYQDTNHIGISRCFPGVGMNIPIRHNPDSRYGAHLPFVGYLQ